MTLTTHLFSKRLVLATGRGTGFLATLSRRTTTRSTCATITAHVRGKNIITFSTLSSENVFSWMGSRKQASWFPRTGPLRPVHSANVWTSRLGHSWFRCRSKYGVVCALCALTVLLVLHFVREYVLPNEFLATSFTTCPHGVIRTSSGHIFSDQPAPHGESKTDLCFVVERSRFLLNSGGFHVGHWGFALTSILGELEKHFRKYNDCFERANVIFTDSKASHNKLTKIESSAAQSEYATSTLSVLSVLTGLQFEHARYGDEKNNLTTTCYQQNTMFVDAGRLPTDDGWIGRFASNASRMISEYFKCNQSATDDVLIYNRRGTRRIRNEADVVSTLHRKGLATKILTPNELSPLCTIHRHV